MGGHLVNYKEKDMETIYNPPSKFFIRAYGTIVRQMGDTVGDEVRFNIYIQTSRHPTIMRWVEWGEFLAESFKNRTSDTHQINESLELYNTFKGEVKGE